MPWATASPGWRPASACLRSRASATAASLSSRRRLRRACFQSSTRWAFRPRRRCMSCTRRVIGFTGGRFAEARTNHVLIKNYSVVGVHWALYNLIDPAVITDTHTELMRLFETGHIDPLVSESVALADVPAALSRLGSRGT